MALWRYGRDVEEITADELRCPRLLGSTNTGKALHSARQWLSRGDTRSSNRIVLLFTDGEATDQDLAEREAVQLKRMGVKLLIGAMDVQQCKVAFPGASLFNVDPAAAAPSLKAMVTRIHSRAY